MLLQPGHERQVIGYSPEKDHGGMGVAVDQTGHDELAATIDNSFNSSCVKQIRHGA